MSKDVIINILVLISFVLTVLPIILSLITKDKEWAKWEILPFVFIFIVLFVIIVKNPITANKEEITFLNTVFFAFFAGGFIQSFTDIVLTRLTLVYYEVKEPIPFPKTPFWMMSLWTLSIIHIIYISKFLEPIGIYAHWISLLIGYLYLETVELITSNFTHWWRGENCHKILNVPIYVFVSKGFSVSCILHFSKTINLFGVRKGLAAGCCIFAIFVVTSWISVLIWKQGHNFQKIN